MLNKLLTFIFIFSFGTLSAQIKEPPMNEKLSFQAFGRVETITAVTNSKLIAITPEMVGHKLTTVDVAIQSGNAGTVTVALFTIDNADNTVSTGPSFGFSSSWGQNTAAWNRVLTTTDRFIVYTVTVSGSNLQGLTIDVNVR